MRTGPKTGIHKASRRPSAREIPASPSEYPQAMTITSNAKADEEAEQGPVQRWMRQSVVTVGTGASVREAAALMREPVVRPSPAGVPGGGT